MAVEGTDLLLIEREGVLHKATSADVLAFVLSDAAMFEVIRDTVAAFIVNSASVTWTHNDVANTLSATATGGGGGGGLAEPDVNGRAFLGC